MLLLYDWTMRERVQVEWQWPKNVTLEDSAQISGHNSGNNIDSAFKLWSEPSENCTR